MTVYDNLCHPYDRYIKKNLALPGAGFFKNQVLTRVGYLAEAPLAAITRAADGVLGVGCGLASLATGGMIHDLNARSFFQLRGGGLILDSTYRALLKTINPKAPFNSESYFRRAWHKKIRIKADGFRDSGNFLKKHVVSRLTYALLGVACVVDRVAHGIIGVVAVPLSFLTLGSVTSINDLAGRSLRAPCIISDLYTSILRVINPWAFEDQ